MATIQISEKHLKNIEKYINMINQKYHKKLSKKAIIDRILNNYYYIVENNMVKSLDSETRLISISEHSSLILKQKKEILHKPMYLILNECLNQFFSYGRNVKKNIALCQFPSTNKTYAFYFDNKKLPIKKGNIIKVKSAHPSNPDQELIKIVKVKDLAYVEDAKFKYKHVIKIIK